MNTPPYPTVSDVLSTTPAAAAAAADPDPDENQAQTSSESVNLLSTNDDVALNKSIKNNDHSAVMTNKLWLQKLIRSSKQLYDLLN